MEMPSPQSGLGQSRPTVSDVYGRTGCPSVISVLAATFNEVTLPAAPHTAYSMVSHLALIIIFTRTFLKVT